MWHPEERSRLWCWVKLETSDNYMAVWLWGHSPGLLTQDLLFLTPGCSASETDACLLAIASISTFKKGNGARIKQGLRNKMMHIAQQRRICLPCMRLLLSSPTGQKPILPPPLTLIFIDQLIDWWLIEGWGQDCFLAKSHVSHIGFDPPRRWSWHWIYPPSSTFPVPRPQVQTPHLTDLWPLDKHTHLYTQSTYKHM